MSESGKPETPQHDTSQIGPLPTTAHVNLQPESILLERYQVIGLLGAGGMGSVFHVKHLHLQSDFALKVLNRQADKTLWRRFENEARAASRLDHPNLIKVYDTGLLPDGQPFFVMEYIKGQTLSDLIAKHGRLPLRKTLKIFVQVGFALAYAHEQGVIHRDLKPSNIMLTRGVDGSLTSSVKVVDLGIAKLSGVDEFNQQTLTRTGEVFGSPLYMSPEQCMGSAVDSRADLYSFGCSMYEALTGAPPMIGENALSTMMKHQMEKPLSLREASMGIEFPREVEQLVAKLLEKDPLSRHKNAQLLTAELVKIEQELGESEGNGPAVTKSLTSISSPKFELRAFLRQHSVTIFLMILCYLLGLATNAVKHSELQKTSNVPSQFYEFALFPNGNSKRQDSSAVEDQAQPYFSELSKDGKTRLFKFPSQSIGRINFGDEFRDAKNNVSAPSNARIFFKPAAMYLDSTLLLKRFRPEELTGIGLDDFARTSMDIFEILPRFKNLNDLQITMDVDDRVIEHLNKIPHLKYLDVSNTRMTGEGLSRLNRLSSLEQLDCSTMDNFDPLAKKLAQCRLKVLAAQSVNMQAWHLKEIGKIKTLEVLDIGGNQSINDEALLGIENLSELVTLRLATCSITGKSAGFFKRFKKLHDLLISDANWSPSQIAELRKGSCGNVDVRGQPEVPLPKEK